MTKNWLPIAVVLAVFGSPASAALIPYYRMDSLAFMASDIVLCDEVHYLKKKKALPWNANYEYQEATFEVVQVLKGNFKPKEQIVVEFGLVYTRRFRESYFRMADDPPLQTIPMGRALLFLTKETDVLQPVTGGAKLIINGEVYTYGQFMRNPGPLWLAKMAPENINVSAWSPFGEDLLLKDLVIAQENAKNLVAPVRESAHDLRIIRRDFWENPSSLFSQPLVYLGIIIAPLFGAICWKLLRPQRHQRID